MSEIEPIYKVVADLILKEVPALSPIDGEFVANVIQTYRPKDWVQLLGICRLLAEDQSHSGTES